MVVVLPTPPFWFATHMTRVRSGRGMVTSPLGFRICTARIASIANGGSSSSRVGVSRETYVGSAATAANDSVEATGASATAGAASRTTAAVGWCGTAGSKRTAAAVLRRPEVDRTSAALTGRLDASGVRRPLAGSGTAAPSGCPSPGLLDAAGASPSAGPAVARSRRATSSGSRFHVKRDRWLTRSRVDRRTCRRHAPVIPARFGWSVRAPVNSATPRLASRGAYGPAGAIGTQRRPPLGSTLSTRGQPTADGRGRSTSGRHLLVHAVPVQRGNPPAGSPIGANVRPASAREPTAGPRRDLRGRRTSRADASARARSPRRWSADR